MKKSVPGNIRGFTLIEMAIVLMISGLLVGSAFSAYSTYLKDRHAHESYDKVKLVDGSLSLFSSFSKRLPCPSNPTIPISDAGSGLEIPTASCDLLKNPITPVGTCIDGVCKALGRDTDDPGTALDTVLIGGVPYASIRRGADPVSTTFNSITNSDILDPWGFQLTYAVSAYLTDTGTYLSSRGAISIETETGVSLVSPPGSALYAIVAAGDNHMGAYTADGIIGVPCAAAGATVDAGNCDGDATFVSGLRAANALGSPLNYFDDTVLYSAFAVSILWDFVGGSDDIYNKNPGFVGIGTSDPAQMLELSNGAISPAPKTYYSIKATSAIQSDLCGHTSAGGANCWSPDLLAAPRASGLALGCADTATPGMMDVVVGVTLDGGGRPMATCGLVPMIAPSLAQSCATPGEFVMGIDGSGAIECGPPPP